VSGRELPVAPAACSLDAEGLAEQGARYAALARSVASLEVRPGRLTAQLAGSVDDSRLDEAIAFERACCPFLAIAHDAEAGRLTIEAAAEHQAVLDAIASALSR
jgi:hypothetical protein